MRGTDRSNATITGYMTNDENATTKESRNVDENLHFVAEVDDIPEGERLIVEIEGREIAVFNVDDAFYALSNYCVHQGGPACEGLISGTMAVDEDRELSYSRDGEIVSCPWHGWEFDIKSGEHLAPSNHRLPTYSVEVRDGDIYVG